MPSRATRLPIRAAPTILFLMLVGCSGGVLIVALIIGGSLWIMGHMNDRMMPAHHAMVIRR